MLAKSPKIKTPLSRKATLLLVSTSCWTARKLDREVTDETNERYHASEVAGRFNKLIIGAEHTKVLTEIINEARALFYKFTLPWADEGPRVLPNANYKKFADEFRPLVRKFEAAADKFERNYPGYVEEAKRYLNGMWKAKDYPAPDTIRSKFKLEMSLLQFPDANDFRADLDEDVLEDIRDELKASSTGEAAMKATVDRIIEVVGHMAEKLKTYKTKDECQEGEKRSFFADTLVGNVRELADLLPSFNLTDDPKLTAITKRIQQELCAEEPDVLREEKDVRASVQASAEEIVKEVSKFFA